MSAPCIDRILSRNDRLAIFTDINVAQSPRAGYAPHVHDGPNVRWSAHRIRQGYARSSDEYSSDVTSDSYDSTSDTESFPRGRHGHTPHRLRTPKSALKHTAKHAVRHDDDFADGYADEYADRDSHYDRHTDVHVPLRTTGRSPARAMTRHEREADSSVLERLGSLHVRTTKRDTRYPKHDGPEQEKSFRDKRTLRKSAVSPAREVNVTSYRDTKPRGPSRTASARSTRRHERSMHVSHSSPQRTARREHDHTTMRSFSSCHSNGTILFSLCFDSCAVVC